MDKSALSHTGTVNSASTEAQTAAEKRSHLPDLSTKALTVCLAGVPNAGKTALMNGLTGGGFHTANYPGVTVTLSRGKSRTEFGAEINFVDLPGVHSTAA